MRTRYYINENLDVYPFTGGFHAHSVEFPGDHATRWGNTGYLTQSAAEDAADEWDRYLKGEISECEFEFGPHTDHTDCQRILDGMEGDDYDPMDDIPWGTPDSWIPDNPNEDGFRMSDFI